MARSVELFAGGGGMALGMLNAGFEHDQLIEIYPAACDTLRKNAERNPSLWKKENVRQMDVRAWLKEPKTKEFQDIDLVAGGPPCQPFSIAAGANASHSNERNMFPAAADCVSVLRPKTFIFENVPGLLRENFLPYYQYIIDRLTRPSIKTRRDDDWISHHSRIKKSRRPAEYDVRLMILDAADLGAPQTRKRIFLIGVRADLAEYATFTGLSLPHNRDRLLYSQWVSGEYWERHGLEAPTIPAALTPKAQCVRHLTQPPDGLPWQTTRDKISQFPEPIDGKETAGVLNHQGIPGAREYRGHTGGWIDWPAKTLKAGVHGVCGGEGMIRFSDGTLRYLTVREAAAIQTFPNDYEFPAVRSIAMRLIGNAVAVTVAETIGRQLRPILEGKRPDPPALDAGVGFSPALHAAEVPAIGGRKRPRGEPSSTAIDRLW